MGAGEGTLESLISLISWRKWPGLGTADCSNLATGNPKLQDQNLHSLLSSSPTPKSFERRLCKFWFCCSGFHVARSLQSAVCYGGVLFN